MAVQKEILKDKPFVATAYSGTYVGADGQDKTFGGEELNTGAVGSMRGTLALGVPGNIYDATPARILTGVLAAAADVGSYVEATNGVAGIIVNSREYANLGVAGDPLKPTLNLPAGTSVSICSFGHVVVSNAEYNKPTTGIAAKANCRVIVGDGTASTGDPIFVVEIDGAKA
ncbi:MAG: hypothetical protein MJZ81_07360 [Bacteroidales bacterium]|nr:hypothetical protein [Bacteroidales bacterium]